MKYVVYGAGGIGGVVGGRLHQVGRAATLIARGEHARVMRERGLRLIGVEGSHQLQVPVVTQPAALQFDPQTVVLLCVKSHQTQQALVDLAAQPGSADSHVVCLQNGVANEALTLRFFRNTYGTVVNLPALFLTPGEVVTHAQGHGGILDTGCYPQGVNAVVEEITADLRDAGFSARPDAKIMRKKYAKLLNNLGNLVQAALSPLDEGSTSTRGEDIRQLHRQLRTEALACYAAAGIDCAGREEVRARREGVYQMGRIPGYERNGGSSWQSLARGTGDIETEFLNGEICYLGRRHGVPTPANDVCVQVARELVSNQSAPGVYTAAQLQARIDTARQQAGG